MVLLPLAAAGYLYYKKQKRAEENENKLRNVETLKDGEETGENDEKTCESSSISSEKGTPISSPRSTVAEVPRGPFGKFMRFCENLEKEFQKAEERKQREALEASTGQQTRLHASIPLNVQVPVEEPVIPFQEIQESNVCLKIESE